MNIFGTCPACGSQIPQERHFNGTVICTCGWSQSIVSKNKETQLNKKTCLSIAIFAAFMVGTFIHIVNWDSHGLAIIPLKAKQALGMASSTDLNHIAQICMEREKYDCSENAYFQAFNYGADKAYLEKLGDLQVKRERMPAAVKTYQHYFKLQGEQDMEAKYNYAKALSATQNYHLADKYFNAVLKAKPNTLQITVTRHYIQMLMTDKKYRKAKYVIEHFRRKGSNTKLFMDKEYKEVLTKLNMKVARK